jgi:hypothetical protein
MKKAIFSQPNKQHHHENRIDIIIIRYRSKHFLNIV